MPTRQAVVFVRINDMEAFEVEHQETVIIEIPPGLDGPAAVAHALKQAAEKTGARS